MHIHIKVGSENGNTKTKQKKDKEIWEELKWTAGFKCNEFGARFGDEYNPYKKICQKMVVINQNLKNKIKNIMNPSNFI